MSASPAWIAAGDRPSASAAAAAQAAFCALCRPRSEPMPPSARDRRDGVPPVARTMLLAVDINSVGERLPHGNAHDVLAGLLQPVGDRAAPFVVDADDRGALRPARRRPAAP